VKILLLGTYELGRQPFGLASPAAWLRRRGYSVCARDLSRQTLDEATLDGADLIVFYLPMHTATRLALQWAKAIRAQRPSLAFCACGLYAPLNETVLRLAGFDYVLGAEFEAELVELVHSLAAGEKVAAKNGEKKLPRLEFTVPDRAGLPALRHYAHVVLPEGTHRTAGYTEASRGCKHLCRHCPIVPVYSGQFRVVPAEIVLADIRQQVAAGAAHITFGDPDFFNGVTHAVRIVEALHSEFPSLTYDATIKVEHLLRHSAALPVLARTGCLFVTSAVESLDDEVLSKLDKGHTRADFFQALDLCEAAGLALQPTFVPFTPWTTRHSYMKLLETLAERDLVSAVPSIQLAIRLLLPARSRLLELPEIAARIGEFDDANLVYPWHHSDPELDELSRAVSAIVAAGEKERLSRPRIFERIWQAAARLQPSFTSSPRFASSSRPVPLLTEPWYC
jgi:radical SAM superfamily enzyme YgiQ (UPF0313 family)